MPSHLTHLYNKLRAVPAWSPRRKAIQHEIEQAEARVLCDEPEIDDQAEERRRAGHASAAVAEHNEARCRLFSDYSDESRSRFQHARAACETARKSLDDLPPSAA